MAKTSAKPSAKATTKDPKKPATRTATTKVSPENRIEKVSEDTLSKLRELNLDQSLQNDIEWCLGSYRSDRNPVGLYDATERALSVLKAEKEKKTKGVTAKLISDIEKALQNR
jgi:hypothetical protein